MKGKPFRNSAFAIFMGAALSGVSTAQSSFDNGGGDNLWSTSTNWDPDGAPSGTITIAGGLAATSNADVSLGSGASVLIGYDPNGFGIGSGPGGNGTLNVTAGTFTYDGGGTFGMALGGSAPQGALNINGTGTVSIQSGNMLIGWDPAGGARGTGTVNVETGGTLNISNPGIQAIGWGTDGFLNITGGTVNQSNGTLQVTGNGGILAGFSMSDGTLNVNQEMRVGNNFAITYGSQSGGTINKLATQVGNFAVGANNAPINYSHTGGTLNVEDNGGSFILGWNSHNDLSPWGGLVYTLDGGTINVGQTSQAGVRIALGALNATMNVQSGSLNVGASSLVGLKIGEDFGGAGNGVLNVSGGSVTVNGGNMYVGVNDGSSGMVNQTGGTVELSPGQTLWVGNPYANSSQGTYNLNGGTLITSSVGIGNNLGSTGSINWGNGTLRNNGNMTFNSSVTMTGSGIWDTNGFNATQLAGVAMTGTGGLTKAGAGTLDLQGNNNYSGATLVSAGTLLVNGSLGGGNAVTVGSSGTIGGDGTISGSLAFNSGADFLFNPGATLTVNGGTVTFGGFGVADLFGLTNAVADGTYTLIDGTATFDFTNVSNFGLANAYNLGGGKSAYFQAGSMNLVVIPEPSTFVSLLGGVGTLALLRRRRERN